MMFVKRVILKLRTLKVFFKTVTRITLHRAL